MSAMADLIKEVCQKQSIATFESAESLDSMITLLLYMIMYPPVILTVGKSCLLNF